MLIWTKQGSALISNESKNENEYEIQETAGTKSALRVNGEVIHFFHKSNNAKKVASLIEEDARS